MKRLIILKMKATLHNHATGSNDRSNEYPQIGGQMDIAGHRNDTATISRLVKLSWWRHHYVNRDSRARYRGTRLASISMRIGSYFNEREREREREKEARIAASAMRRRLRARKSLDRETSYRNRAASRMRENFWPAWSSARVKSSEQARLA